MQSRYLGALLLLGAVWGASYLFIKIGVQELPPETLVALRLLIAALILTGIVYARGLRLPVGRRAWLDFFGTSAIGVVLPYLLITWGEQSISSGSAAILTATTPLFTVLLASIWTREDQLSAFKLLGVGVGFVGVVVAIGLEEIDLGSASLQGQLAVLLAACCYGINGIYSRRAFRGMPALVGATGQMIAGTLLIAPLALVRQGIPSALPSAQAIGAVLALGVFGTALAYILLYWLLEQVGPTQTSMVTYLLPPFALIYGAIFLAERITLNTLAGLGLIIIGILLCNGVIRIAHARSVTSQIAPSPPKSRT